MEGTNISGGKKHGPEENNAGVDVASMANEGRVRLEGDEKELGKNERDGEEEERRRGGIPK